VLLTVCAPVEVLTAIPSQGTAGRMITLSVRALYGVERNVQARQTFRELNYYTAADVNIIIWLITFLSANIHRCTHNNRYEGRDGDRDYKNKLSETIWVRLVFNRCGTLNNNIIQTRCRFTVPQSYNNNIII